MTAFSGRSLKHGRSVVNATLMIKSQDNLKEIINKLRGIRSVTDVYRISNN